MMNILNAKVCSLVLVLTILSVSVYAQQDSGGSVEFIKDARIDVLVKKQSQINKVAVYKNSRGDYKGYRIMLLSTNDRTLAYKTRADLLRNFPTETVYMAYQSPYFKIRVGDFLKKEDAVKFKKDLSIVFKQTTYVVPDIIRLKPDEEAKLLSETGNKRK